ncbi:hypothetical protein [Streptomyces scabiei]|uniref:hypothetical protein n=1 Tax=Streptomyces scabiei TaxID=1930 RepID=UPI0029B91273|nr:hypothetical protein [Streptomyces scabiei]MDX3517040.1 hypothetical protein [Streptomyces scabiei]
MSTEPAVTALVADPLTRLADEGVSVRLDGFSRTDVVSGGLAKPVGGADGMRPPAAAGPP